MARRILVIDDNETLAQILRAVLERNDFEVGVALDATTAIEMLNERVYDLLISDVMMPGQDGLWLARRVRENPTTARTPIIYLTSLDSIEDEFEGYLAGGDAWITKPFRARELLQKVEQVLEGPATTPASRRLLLNTGRVLAFVTGRQRELLQQACQVASCELELVATLDEALRRVAGQPCDLLVCEAGSGIANTEQLHDFLDHFALALPVLMLIERETGNAAAAAGFHTLLLPAPAEALAARLREILGTDKH